MNEKTTQTEEIKMEAETAQTTEELNTQRKLSRKKYGMIGGMVVILLAVIIGFSIYNTPANRLARQLDLGQRYLEELNYEQAIVEFDKAIAIDPMSVEAYLGKAEAYISLDDLDAAMETLQTGYENTKDEVLKAKLDEIYSIKKMEEGRAKALAGMQHIYELMEAEDYKGAREEADKIDYQYLEEAAPGSYIYCPRQEASLSGDGIGIYGKNRYLYFGNYVNGTREGAGIYVSKDGLSGFTVYLGEWKNDKPNGSGEIIRQTVEIWGNGTWDLKGNLVDGLWNGEVERQLIQEDDAVFNLTFWAENGIAESKTEEYQAWRKEWGLDDEVDDVSEPRVVTAYDYIIIGDFTEIIVCVTELQKKTGVMGWADNTGAWAGISVSTSDDLFQKNVEAEGSTTEWTDMGAEVYMARAGEYVLETSREFWRRGEMEFDPWVVNVSLVENTANQCRVMVETNEYFSVGHFEVVIDKSSGQGTLGRIYWSADGKTGPFGEEYEAFWREHVYDFN